MLISRGRLISSSPVRGVAGGNERPNDTPSYLLGDSQQEKGGSTKDVLMIEQGRLLSEHEGL
jgi:hypothetical protein